MTDLGGGFNSSGGNRPETVIHWDHAQGPLPDQKAAVGPSCIILPQLKPKFWVIPKASLVGPHQHARPTLEKGADSLNGPKCCKASDGVGHQAPAASRPGDWNPP